MAEENVTLAFIGMYLERLTTEVASLRDDMRVMGAIPRQQPQQPADQGEERPFPDLQDNRLRKVEDKELG